MNLECENVVGHKKDKLIRFATKFWYNNQCKKANCVILEGNICSSCSFKEELDDVGLLVITN